MNLKELKKYPMPEAVYLAAFELSKADVQGKTAEKVFKDYEHLGENVQEALEVLTDWERQVLTSVLDQKRTLEEVGDEFRMERERARQILAKSFRKLGQPSCQQILNGTKRRRELAAKAEQERLAAVEESWKMLAVEIERQNAERLAQMKTKLAVDINTLGLSPGCEQKLRKIVGVNTIDDLLEKFPYDATTSGLTGLAVAPGIGKADYQEIWFALFMAGLLVHQWKLPDFDALRQAEQIAMPGSDPDGMLGISVNQMWLSIRSRNCLSRAGIKTVGDFCQRLKINISDILAMRQFDLAHQIYELEIRNMGVKTADEIAMQLQKVLQDEISLREAHPAER